MTTEELEQLLAQQPIGLLHRLARGRVHRHFRAGKRRLIELLAAPLRGEPRRFESDLLALIADRQSQARPSYSRAASPCRRGGQEPRQHSVALMHRPITSRNTMSRLSHWPAWLEGIGVPPPQPFVPDPWQEEALCKVADESDVIVSVPTGSGKTYVAVEAARRAMEENRTVIYTSPLKALSNTKYTEFSRIFGADQVGILTGDRRDNAQAPLLIMTTEILRNLLYDAGRRRNRRAAGYLRAGDYGRVAIHRGSGTGRRLGRNHYLLPVPSDDCSCSLPRSGIRRISPTG